MNMNGSVSRRDFVMLGSVVLAGLGLSACAGGSGSGATGSTASGAKGSVYYLNFKPEVDDQWQALAKKYTDAKGIDVKVVTAASGTYEEKLKSEMAKSSAPTLFQVSGYVGLANWKEYCADLSGSGIYGQLTNSDLVLKDGSKVDAIGFVEEDYGIVYNKSLLSKAGYKESDITDFASLKKVADDIQARKDALGIKGAFVSSGLDSSSSWRFTNHLANMPLYFEFKDDNVTNPDTIKGTYLSSYKDIFDLYITDRHLRQIAALRQDRRRRRERVRQRRRRLLPERHLGLQGHQVRRRRQPRLPAHLHRRGRPEEPGAVRRHRELLVRQLRCLRRGPAGDARLHQLGRHLGRRHLVARQRHGLLLPVQVGQGAVEPARQARKGVNRLR
jgi:hypothetical protein